MVIKEKIVLLEGVAVRLDSKIDDINKLQNTFIIPKEMSQYDG